MIFSALMASDELQEFKFQPKLLGYITGQPWECTNGAHVEVY
jgi:hypothetical protein